MAEITKISKRAFAMVLKCQHTKKTFGVTIDPTEKGYKRVWSFKISESKAAYEGYDVNTVHGKIYSDKNYPGCPYCGNKLFVFCQCGNVYCGEGDGYSVCPYCGTGGDVRLANNEEFDLKGGGY